MAQRVKFFDIQIDRFSDKSLYIKLENILDGLAQTLIATPNPEMLMAAYNNDKIADTLHKMTLKIPDGFGLSLMSILTGQGKLKRHPGTDILVDVARFSAKRNMHILILGASSNSSSRAKLILESAFPGLRVSYLSDINISLIKDKWNQPDDLLNTIRDKRPDVIAVALGSAGYEKQERWIVDHVPQFASVKLAIGVGGAIDMISGVTKRAPKWMRACGIEWLWRLIVQPSRINRIITAVIRFPLAVIKDTIASKR